MVIGVPESRPWTPYVRAAWSPSATNFTEVKLPSDIQESRGTAFLQVGGGFHHAFVSHSTELVAEGITDAPSFRRTVEDHIRRRPIIYGVTSGPDDECRVIVACNIEKPSGGQGPCFASIWRRTELAGALSYDLITFFPVGPNWHARKHPNFPDGAWVKGSF